jgi:enoyl-CoA hydratase/carnithine racemase
MTGTDPVLRLDVGDHVSHVVLNRPDKLNALDESARLRLVKTIQECGADDDVHVIVIRGEGRAFCAGADASNPNQASPDGAWADRVSMSDRGWGQFLVAWDAPKPVIAQVHGVCLGIASILCNLCDIVVVAEDARIGWPKLPLGGGVISPTWVWHVGIHRAKELSYQIGSEISGIEAAQWGFANRAVPADRLDADVDGLARSIAKVPLDLLRLKKEALNQVYDSMGFRQAVMNGSLWGALSHDLPSTGDVRALVGELGLKDAIAHYRGVEP